MASGANINVGQTISVRFSSRSFNPIVKRWKDKFPQAEFRGKPKYWEIPVANFEDVKEFCEKHFFEVKVEFSDDDSTPTQLSLNI